MNIHLHSDENDVVNALWWPNCYSKSNFLSKWCVFGGL